MAATLFVNARMKQSMSGWRAGLEGQCRVFCLPPVLHGVPLTGLLRDLQLLSHFSDHSGKSALKCVATGHFHLLCNLWMWASTIGTAKTRNIGGVLLQSNQWVLLHGLGNSFLVPLGLNLCDLLHGHGPVHKKEQLLPAS